VHLDQDRNQIKLDNDAAYAPDLDRVVVSAAK
jgi:hypothetical protein